MLARLYGAMRLFVNFFQPSFKLAAKACDGAKVTKRYHPPATPCERLMADVRTSEEVRRRLEILRATLDPFRLLQQIRAAVTHLRARGAADLAQVTLMSDGVSVYECTSPDEVVDLLQGGQGVFGIALGRVWQEVEGTLAELPSERADDDDATAATVAADDLAKRRLRRTS